MCNTNLSGGVSPISVHGTLSPSLSPIALFAYLTPPPTWGSMIRLTEFSTKDQFTFQQFAALAA
jgi:hypothetical protein